MLLKLVRVFGSVIYSSISAPSSVGVDIEAEQRCDSISQNISYYPYYLKSPNSETLVGLVQKVGTLQYMLC